MSFDPASQIEDLAKSKLNNRLGLRKELKQLPSHLAEGEQVVNLSSGMYDGANGLVVLTDRRVIFTSAGMVKSRFEDFPYSKISSVQHSSGVMFGELTLFASGNRAELKQMLKDRAKEIATYVRERAGDGASAVAAPPAAPPPAEGGDVADQIRKLGELKEQGLLSQDEFDAQKRKLLGM